MATRIHLSTADEKTDASVGELAVGEMRPEVAGGAVPLADEDAQSFLRRLRVFAERSAVPRCQPVPEFVERRAAADQRLLERRQRLADVDEHLFVLGRWRAPECAFVLLRKNTAYEAGHMPAAGIHLPSVEQG